MRAFRVRAHRRQAHDIRVVAAEKPALESIDSVGTGRHVGKIRRKLPHPRIRPFGFPSKAGRWILKQNDASTHRHQRKELTRQIVQFLRES